MLTFAPRSQRSCGLEHLTFSRLEIWSMKHPLGHVVSGIVSLMLGTAVLAQNNPTDVSQPGGQASGVWQAPNTAHPGGKLPKDVKVQLVEVAGGFVDPIHITSANDGTGRLFVCERPGVIRIIDKDGKVMDEPFYDNRANTSFQFLENGLYCVEFSPKFKANGLLYIAYADMWFNGATFVVEYHVDPNDPNKVDMSSARPIIRIDFPYCNHHGGKM